MSTIGDAAEYVTVLVRLSSHLPNDEREPPLAATLETIGSIPNQHLRAARLGALAAVLPPALMPAALGTARSIPGEEARARALLALMQHLPQTSIPAALDAVLEIIDEAQRAACLGALHDRLKPELHDRALVAARSLARPELRWSVLAAMSTSVPEEQRNGLVGEALEAAREISDATARARALVALLEILTPDGEVVALAGALDAIDAALARSATALPTFQLLLELLDHLPDALAARALQIAGTLGNEYWRSLAISKLAESMPAALFEDALAMAQHLSGSHETGRVLRDLAPRLPSELISPAADAGREIDDLHARAWTLSTLALRAAELGDAAPQDADAAALVVEALAEARRIEDARGRADVLAVLSEQVPELERDAVFLEAVAAVREIDVDSARSNDVIAYARLAPKHLLVTLANTILDVADESERTQALRALYKQSPERMLEMIVGAAKELTDGHTRAELIAGLPGPSRAEVLDAAVKAAIAVPDDRQRVRMLAGLTSHVPRATAQKAAEQANGIADPKVRANMLTALAAALPEPGRSRILVDALEATRQLELDARRARAVRAIADAASGDARAAALAEALEVACGLRADEDRRHALNELVHRADDLSPPQLHRVWTVLLAETGASTRSDLLKSHELVVLLERLGGQAAVRHALEWIYRTARWWP